MSIHEHTHSRKWIAIAQTCIDSACFSELTRKDGLELLYIWQTHSVKVPVRFMFASPLQPTDHPADLPCLPDQPAPFNRKLPARASFLMLMFETTNQHDPCFAFFWRRYPGIHWARELHVHHIHPINVCPQTSRNSPVGFCSAWLASTELTSKYCQTWPTFDIRPSLPL